jgi:hypothetical protein
MQIDFTPNELQMLTETLAHHNHELGHEIARTDHREFKQMLQAKLDVLIRLQTQLVRGEVQFSPEESDALSEVLDQSENTLYLEIARSDDRDFKHLLRNNLECLETAHKKISGACKAA